ncbi:MAG TPA: hypothetical protein P5084_02860 [Paludibacter sp.]|nr:hypothetical protein [Paludibacter sp.]
MGFFNLYKPKEYKYRYIYYDPKKEALKEREKQETIAEQVRNGEYKPTIRRGTFREMADKNKNFRNQQTRQSNIRIVIIIIILLAIAYFLLK